MRNLKLLSIITIMLFFVGCKSGNKTEDKITESTAETHQMTDTPKGLVKKYVEENTYIDVDIPSIAYGLANPSAVSGTISGDDMAKGKGRNLPFLQERLHSRRLFNLLHPKRCGYKCF